MMRTFVIEGCKAMNSVILNHSIHNGSASKKGADAD